MSDGHGDAAGVETDGIDGQVERQFTCTVCGFGVEREVPLLSREITETCVNCGEWAVLTADQECVVDAAREAAEALAGPVVTEKQALAYLLREHVGLDRAETAAELDSSVSNVDNLHRRGREKLAEARRVVDAVDALTVDADIED